MAENENPDRTPATAAEAIETTSLVETLNANLNAPSSPGKAAVITQEVAPEVAEPNEATAAQQAVALPKSTSDNEASNDLVVLQDSEQPHNNMTSNAKPTIATEQPTEQP